MGAVNAELLAIADLILIPLNPTPVDLRALVKGLPIVRDARRPFNFVLTRVRANLRNNESAAMALESLGLVIATRIHERDLKRLVRALEVYFLTGRPLTAHFADTTSPLPDVDVIGIALRLPAAETSERVTRRVDQQFARGLLEEIRTLLDLH